MIYLQLKAEFGRVAGDKDIVKEMTAKFEKIWQQKILALARQRKVATHLFSEAEDILLQEPDRKTGIYTNFFNIYNLSM